MPKQVRHDKIRDADNLYKMQRRSNFKPHWWGIIRFLRDPKADWKPKAALALAILYIIWPIDLIPDVAPVIGWLDDIGFTALAVGYVLYASNQYMQAQNRLNKIDNFKK